MTGVCVGAVPAVPGDDTWYGEPCEAGGMEGEMLSPVPEATGVPVMPVTNGASNSVVSI